MSLLPLPSLRLGRDHGEGHTTPSQSVLAPVCLSIACIGLTSCRHYVAKRDPRRHRLLHRAPPLLCNPAVGMLLLTNPRTVSKEGREWNPILSGHRAFA